MQDFEETRMDAESAKTDSHVFSSVSRER